MERSAADACDKLNRLLEISEIQLRFISENNIEDFMTCQAERAIIFESLGDPASIGRDPDVRLLADRLIESDRLLASAVQALMGGISSKLNQLKTGRSAVKAYARG